MLMLRARTLVLLAALAGGPSLVFAQLPKVGGKYYEEKVDLGFRFKAPADWEFIPPQPGDPNTLGKYAPKFSAGLQIKTSSGVQTWQPELFILKFDRRKQLTEVKGKDGEKIQVSAALGAKSIDKWVEQGLLPGLGIVWKAPLASEIKAGKLVGKQLEFIGTMDEGEMGFYAAQFAVSSDVDVVIGFNGAGDKKTWTKSLRSFEAVARTFQIVAADALSDMGGPAGTSARDLKRFDLEKQILTSPGWFLEETPNYFIVSSNTDRPFVQEVMERLEAIRAVYEETYPPSLAEELNRAAAEAKAKAEAQAKADAEAKAKAGESAPDTKEKPKPDSEGEKPDSPRKPEPPPAPPPADDAAQEAGRSTTQEVSPMERSRCSVVRVCSSADEYHKYGGPGGSAGYWNSADEELVIYDDKAGGGRGDTWATLNHEAFHQYIYYFFGRLAPHSWYNEGTGDFYSGYEYRNKRFFLKPFDWREGLIQEALRRNLHQPWSAILKFTQQEYYSNSRHKDDPNGTPNIARNYAQGWSMVYFLRTGKKSARGWNPRWDTILDTYLRTLVVTDDLDKAVEVAFEGIDMADLEKCWRDYILSL